MSIYCYLACQQCRENVWVKDSDTAVHCDPVTLGQFLEKHTSHPLIYLWEDHTMPLPDGRFADEIPRFEMPIGGRWSHGTYFPPITPTPQPDTTT